MADDRLARMKRLRREPPPLQSVAVLARAELSVRMLRLTFEGDGLRGLCVEQPASSVRLLVSSPGAAELVIPDWNGNEFLLPDGHRPVLRTFTPLRVDTGAGRLDLEVVRHRGGAVSEWAETAEVGAPAAISGPGSGYDIPADAARLIVLADETALPAVTQLVEVAPESLRLEIHIEIIVEDAVIPVDTRPGDSIEWYVSESGAVAGNQLVDVVTAIAELPDGTHVWAAGEASAMHAIRSHLFETLGIERSRATVRGYWKPPR